MTEPKPEFNPCLRCIGVWILLWLLCATISYGGALAYDQGKYPMIANEYCREDMADNMGVGLLTGPIGLFTSFFQTGFYKYGFKWTCGSGER